MKKFTINSLNLREILKVKVQYSKWIIRRITKFKLKENEDYVIEVKNQTRVYMLTPASAKLIAIKEETNAGKLIANDALVATSVNSDFTLMQAMNAVSIDFTPDQIALYQKGMWEIDYNPYSIDYFEVQEQWLEDNGAGFNFSCSEASKRKVKQKLVPFHKSQRYHIKQALNDGVLEQQTVKGYELRKYFQEQTQTLCDNWGLDPERSIVEQMLEN